jgi:hypothetical protein
MGVAQTFTLKVISPYRKRLRSWGLIRAPCIPGFTNINRKARDQLKKLSRSICMMN